MVNVRQDIKTTDLGRSETTLGDAPSFGRTKYLELVHKEVEQH